jgi:alpha-ketoglutarate-dependent 2,4-dichlorophenoxyacetate dioxygenase
MWDNRAVVHRGTGFDKGRYRRVMIRTTIAGEGPTVALSPDMKAAA